MYSDPLSKNCNLHLWWSAFQKGPALETQKEVGRT